MEPVFLGLMALLAAGVVSLSSMIFVDSENARMQKYFSHHQQDLFIQEFMPGKLDNSELNSLLERAKKSSK